jgi:flagellar hook protein FlgE
VNSGLVTTSVVTAHTYTYNPTGGLGGAGGLGNNKTFTTIADLRNQMELEANKDIDGDGIIEGRVEVTVTNQGKIEVSNPGGSDDDYDISLAVTAFSRVGSPSVTENERFTKNMEAMNATLAAGSTGNAFSQSFNAATHSSSIDVFDSLGSKHTIRMEFRKTALSTTTGSRWDMKISVPLPATIDNTAPTNEKGGFITFGPDGSLSNFDPPNVSFTGNNGSSADQQIKLTFGTTGMYDGMTSFDSRSSTSGISQDGFTGGDLVGIRIDQSGTIVGSFSNGRSFGLAQVGMAKFTNNEGLSTQGGSVYVQTANSGDPIIGSAATSGRGFIQSSALEASNVDLSRSLTQLIIIQRGYQANGKTITTSDQLLQTLIGLKN